MSDADQKPQDDTLERRQFRKHLRRLRLNDKEEAVKRDYHHMTWQVLDWNKGAIRFYKRLGAELDGQWVNGRLDKAQLSKLAAQ